MTITDITVEGLDFRGLAGINIIEAAHAHGTCELSFVLAGQLETKQLLQLDGQKVTVKAKDDIIFCGIVNRCEVVEQVIGRILVVTLLSLSCQMDLARKTKTYQSANKEYSDIADDIKNGGYADAEIDCSVDDTIAELVYRDNKTDWQFLKDLAERHGQILFVYTKTDKLKLSIGFKAFQKFLFINPKLVSRNLPMDFFLRLEQNTYEGARSSYFLETTLELSDLTVGVGCSVRYDNVFQVVIAGHIYSKDNNLYNEVTLRPKEGCRADAWDVMRHFDECYYLSAKVLEAHGNPDNAADNYIKVQFDCDENQDADEALNIPFESSVSNYLYTMPDVGEKVCVYVDRWRLAAMTALRTRAVDDAAEKRSLKIPNASIIFDPDKFSFTATETTELKHENGMHLLTNNKKNIVFSSAGDIIIQSAQGKTQDGQLNMVVPQTTGYAQYTGAAGQPATVKLSFQISAVGQDVNMVKLRGSKKEAVELSELARNLDAITHREARAEEAQEAAEVNGGKLNFNGQGSALIQVEDSSIEMKGSDLNVKTKALFQIAYTPAAGGGSGSLSKFEGGNPGNRSEQIEIEHGSENRERIRENIPPLPDDKRISV